MEEYKTVKLTVMEINELKKIIRVLADDIRVHISENKRERLESVYAKLTEAVSFDIIEV